MQGWCGSSVPLPTDLRRTLAGILKADSGLDSRVDTESEVMGERILVVTAGLSGLLYSSVELARRLATVGHHVTYAGPATARPLAEQHDLGFLALPPSQYDQFLEADAAAGAIRRLVELRRRRQRAAESMACLLYTSDAADDLQPV